MADSTVGVVTVTFNSSAVLPGFLDSLPNASRRHAEVVIVDNASPTLAATPSIAVDHSARLVRLERNLGYGAAVNAGVAALGGRHDWILISNPDIKVHENAIDVLIEQMMERPKVGAAGPAVLETDGSIYPSARNLPSLRTGIGHALFSGPWPRNPWTRSYHAELSPTNSIREAGWLSGSCLLVRRAAFEQIDGFDPEFFMYFEDVDFGRRLSLAGWTNLYVPDARVTHAGGHSTKSDPRPMIQAHHVSAARYVSTRYSSPVLAPLRAIIRIGLKVRASRAARIALRQSA